MLNYGSTARSLGMGNSFGALGADLSVLSTNPAGIGMYRRSEFSLSPLFSNSTTNSTYMNNKSADDYFKFAFGNIGAVWTSQKDQPENDWKSWSFGISYIKTNDFNARSMARGVNTRNSLTDNFIEGLNGTSYDSLSTLYPFDVDLAWQTFLIDTVAGSGSSYIYQSTIPKNSNKLQTSTTETTGGQGEWDFSLGTNYRDKLYLGITLGLTSIHYQSISSWEENDNTNSINGFSSFKFTETLKTTGAGFTVKLGAIYKPTDEIRLGLAIHSSNESLLSDNYSSTMRTTLDNGQTYSYGSPGSSFDYSVTTPFKVLASAAAIIAKTAAVNFDYDYTNYNQMKMHATDATYDYYFSPINSDIKVKYTGVHTFRLGAELKNGDFRYRAGAEYATSPFKKEYRPTSSYDQSKVTVSTGFGIRHDSFYVDFAIAHTESGSYYRPYSLQSEATNPIFYRRADNRLLTTIGFIF
jgi:hypothetical protein